MLITQIILLILSLISSNMVLAANKCYKCSTTYDSKCSDPFTGTSNTCTNTKNEEINCVKYNYTLNGREIIYRGCRVASDTCKEIEEALTAENKKLSKCCMCSTDLCTNYDRCAAPSVGLTLFVLFLILPTLLV